MAWCGLEQGAVTGGEELLVLWEGTRVPQLHHGSAFPSNDTTFVPEQGWEVGVTEGQQ